MYIYICITYTYMYLYTKIHLHQVVVDRLRETAEISTELPEHEQKQNNVWSRELKFHVRKL